MTVRGRRAVTRLAAVAALAAALGLAGCSAHPGVAAVVGDRTITQDDLARTQREIGPVLNDASSPGILVLLIETPVFIQGAADKGVGVSVDDAIALLDQTAQTASLAKPDEWSAGSVDIARFTLAVQGLQELDGGTDLLNELKAKAAELDVEVNPQYGTWQDGTIAAADLPWLTAPDTATAP